MGNNNNNKNIKKKEAKLNMYKRKWTLPNRITQIWARVKIKIRFPTSFSGPPIWNVPLAPESCVEK